MELEIVIKLLQGIGRQLVYLNIMILILLFQRKH